MKYKKMKQYIMENEDNNTGILNICEILNNKLEYINDMEFKFIRERTEIFLKIKVGTEKEILEILDKLKITKTLNNLKIKIITLEFLLNDNSHLMYNSQNTPILDTTLEVLNKSLNFVKLEKIEGQDKIIFLSFDNNLEALLDDFTKIELDIVFPNKNIIDNIEIYLNPNTLKNFDEFNDYLKLIRTNKIFECYGIKSILFIFKESPDDKFKEEEDFLEFTKKLEENVHLNSFELEEFNKSKAFRFRG